MKVHIRWMLRRDGKEVLEIETAGFEHPWTENDFLNALRQRNCIGMVAENAERIVGYLIYMLHKTHLHLLNFAVHPDHRRAGIGRAMVRKLVDKLSTHRRTRMTTIVRESNLPAQLFFKACGFNAEDVLRNYYDQDSGDDGYVFTYRVEEDDPVFVHRSVNRINQFEEET